MNLTFKFICINLAILFVFLNIHCQIQSQIDFLEKCQELFQEIEPRGNESEDKNSNLVKILTRAYAAKSDVKEMKAQINALNDFVKTYEMVAFKYIFVEPNTRRYPTLSQLLDQRRKIYFPCDVTDDTDFLKYKFGRTKFNHKDVAGALLPSGININSETRFMIAKSDICDPTFVHDYLRLIYGLFDNQSELKIKKRLLASINQAINLPSSMRQKKLELINFLIPKHYPEYSIDSGELKTLQNNMESIKGKLQPTKGLLTTFNAPNTIITKFRKVYENLIFKNPSLWANNQPPSPNDNYLEALKSGYVQYLKIDPDSNVYIIGDLHSNITVLSTILKDLEKKGFLKSGILAPKNYLIFLGDYGDMLKFRSANFIESGKNTLDLLSQILKLKLLNFNQVFMLLGNHEMECWSFSGCSVFSEIRHCFPLAIYIKCNSMLFMCSHSGFPIDLINNNQIFMPSSKCFYNFIFEKLQSSEMTYNLQNNTIPLRFESRQSCNTYPTMLTFASFYPELGTNQVYLNCISPENSKAFFENQPKLLAAFRGHMHTHHGIRMMDVKTNTPEFIDEYTEPYNLTLQRQNYPIFTLTNTKDDFHKADLHTFGYGVLTMGNNGAKFKFVPVATGKFDENEELIEYKVSSSD